MTLTRAEMFRGNLALTKQHLLDVLADPTPFEWIPNGAHVIGLPLDNRKLFEANMKLAHRLALKCDDQPIILLPEKTRRKVTRKKSAVKANHSAKKRIAHPAVAR